MSRGGRLIFGVGVNDADYPTSSRATGRLVHDPAYVVWSAMLARCYGEKGREKRPTYDGVTVCPEWLSFMAFRAWLVQQHDWQNRQIDKDLIAPGCKLYSPATCLMVPGEVNMLFVVRPKGTARNAALPVGVSFTGSGYRAQIRADGRQQYGPTRKAPEEAAADYRDMKLRRCLTVAHRYLDDAEPRIFAAIIDNAARVYAPEATQPLAQQ